MTQGEVLAIRRLEQIQRDGAWVYDPGHHGARMHGTRHAQLTYVDHNGFLIVMPCFLSETRQWAPMGQIIRCSASGTLTEHRVPDGFELSVKMLHALRSAHERTQ